MSGIEREPDAISLWGGFRWNDGPAVDPVAALHRAIEQSHMPVSQIVPRAFLSMGPRSFLLMQVDSAIRGRTLSTLAPYAAHSALAGLYRYHERRGGSLPSLLDMMRAACRSVPDGNAVAERWAEATEAVFTFASAS